MSSTNKKQDTNPQETKEWIDSIKSLIHHSGSDRAHFILDKLIAYSRSNGIRMPYQANTDYINTIPLEQQEPYSGDRSIERRIKSIIRWNAMAMVTKANKTTPGIGGHISTYASAATLYEVAFNHVLKAQTTKKDRI